MKEINLTYLGTILFVLLFVIVEIEAQGIINGSLGVDLHAISSSSKSNFNSYPANNATRFISNHYISFANGGNIKTENFASYSLSVMLKGFFTSMKTNTLSLGSYSSPNLNNFSGNITFFPKRSYPLRLYYLKVKDVSLKYNEAERSKTELLTPGLAVLQKKRMDDQKYGTAFSSKLFNGASIETSYDNQSTDNSYDYDFDEDRNIVVSSLELPGDIYNNTVTVIFNNKIEDDSVRIISGTINEIIPPEFSTTITFDSGFHFIDIIPLHNYKQSSVSVNMKQGQNYVIDIEIEKFPVKSDIISEITEAAIEFNYLSKSLKLKTNYSYIDLFSASTSLKEISDGIRNTLSYRISRKIDLLVNTEKTIRESSTDGLNKQVADNSQNLTTINFTQRKGIIGSLSHDYKKSVNENNDGSESKTNNTKYTAKLALPSERFKHLISLNSELIKQDKTGTIDDKSSNISYEMMNRMEFYYKKLKIIPLNSIKIDSRNKTADTLENNSKGLTINSSLEGSQINSRLLGDVSSKFGYVYSKTDEESGTKSSSQAIWDFMLLKNISEKHSISLTTSHAWRFTGDVDGEIRDSITQQSVVITVVTPTDYSNSTSVSYNSNQFEDVEFSTTLSLANSKGTKTTGVLIRLNTYIPYIKFPFTTEIMKQYRDLEGMPRQTSFMAETLISYRYNQINMKISHLYSKEKLILDTYKFYELSINITRDFGI